MDKAKKALPPIIGVVLVVAAFFIAGGGTPEAAKKGVVEAYVNAEKGVGVCVALEESGELTEEQMKAVAEVKTYLEGVQEQAKDIAELLGIPLPVEEEEPAEETTEEPAEETTEEDTEETTEAKTEEPEAEAEPAEKPEEEKAEEPAEAGDAE